MYNIGQPMGRERRQLPAYYHILMTGYHLVDCQIAPNVSPTNYCQERLWLAL